MSFILDALRKAEDKNRDRHTMTVPTGPRVLTEELPEAPVERRSFGLFLIPILLVALVLIWFATKDPSPTPAGPPSAAGQQPAAQAQTDAAPLPASVTARPAERVNVQRETGTRALDREVQRGSIAGSSAASSRPDASTQNPSTPSTQNSVQANRPVTPGTVRILEADGTVSEPQTTVTSGRVEVETLPEYRSSLASGEVPIPQLHLDMHVYSAQPDKRFVFINLDKYVEGDSIDGDTTIESIEPEGAVINYKGYRFVLRPE